MDIWLLRNGSNDSTAGPAPSVDCTRPLVPAPAPPAPAVVPPAPAPCAPVPKPPTPPPGVPCTTPPATPRTLGPACAGTSGLVQSTLGAGPAVESFDPFLSSQMSIERATFPLANTVQTGVANFNQNTATANFAYNQGFVTGTSMSVGFDNNRQISNSTRSALQPTINSSFRFTLTQHLLQGLGILPQRRFIMI